MFPYPAVILRGTTPVAHLQGCAPRQVPPPSTDLRELPKGSKLAKAGLTDLPFPLGTCELSCGLQLEGDRPAQNGERPLSVLPDSQHFQAGMVLLVEGGGSRGLAGVAAGEGRSEAGREGASGVTL